MATSLPGDKWLIIQAGHQEELIRVLSTRIRWKKRLAGR